VFILIASVLAVLMSVKLVADSRFVLDPGQWARPSES